MISPPPSPGADVRRCRRCNCYLRDVFGAIRGSRVTTSYKIARNGTGILIHLKQASANLRYNHARQADRRERTRLRFSGKAGVAARS